MKGWTTRYPDLDNLWSYIHDIFGNNLTVTGSNVDQLRSNAVDLGINSTI